MGLALKDLGHVQSFLELGAHLGQQSTISLLGNKDDQKQINTKYNSQIIQLGDQLTSWQSYPLWNASTDCFTSLDTIFIRIDFVLLDYLLTSRLQIFSRSSIINVPEHNRTYKCLEVRQFSSIQEIYRIFFPPLLNQALRLMNFGSNLLMLSTIMSVAIAD